MPRVCAPVMHKDERLVFQLRGDVGKLALVHALTVLCPLGLHINTIMRDRLPLQRKEKLRWPLGRRCQACHKALRLSRGGHSASRNTAKEGVQRPLLLPHTALCSIHSSCMVTVKR